MYIGLMLKTNHEVLEARDDHTEDVPAVYRRVMDMGRANIMAIHFKDGSP